MNPNELVLSKIAPVDDLWIKTFYFLNVGDFVAINSSCKYFNKLSNVYKEQHKEVDHNDEQCTRKR